MRPQSLISSVALGLSLAFASLSHAAPSARAQRQAAVAAKLAGMKDQLARHGELTALISHPMAHDGRIDLLLRHEERFGSGTRSMTLAKGKGFRLQTEVARILFVPQKGEPRLAVPADLIAAGIDSIATYSKRLGDRIHELADMRPTANDEAKATARLEQEIADANRLVNDLHQHPDVALLRHHAERVTSARTGAPKGFVLGAKPGDEIVISSADVVRMKDDVAYGVSFADLARHDLGTRALVDKRVGELVIATAKVRGATKGATALERAREKLSAEIAIVDGLNAIISNPAGSSTNLAELINVYSQLPARSDGTKPRIRLAATRTEALEIEPRNPSSSWPPRANALVVVDKKGQRLRDATIADLHAFKIDTLTDFDVAVENAILNSEEIQL